MLLSLVEKESDRSIREEMESLFHPLVLLLWEGRLVRSDDACYWSCWKLILGKPFRIGFSGFEIGGGGRQRLVEWKRKRRCYGQEATPTCSGRDAQKDKGQKESKRYLMKCLKTDVR